MKPTPGVGAIGLSDSTGVPDATVTVRDVPAECLAWSVDMTQPVDPCEGVFWRIEYDDTAGVHRVIENVPQFPPGEGPCDWRWGHSQEGAT